MEESLRNSAFAVFTLHVAIAFPNYFLAVYEKQKQQLPIDRTFPKPTYYGPFEATQNIWGGGQNVPSISYACSRCSVTMKIPQIPGT